MQKNISLDNHLESNNSFPSAYLRALASIASKDGIVNLAEFTALIGVLNQLGDSALAEIMLLHALEHPISTSEAYKQLDKACEFIDAPANKVAFESAKPLLVLQGQDGREIAEKLASSLRYKASENELDEISSSQAISIWKKVTGKTLKAFKPKGVSEYAEECFIATGDADLFDKIRAFNAGNIEQSELKLHVIRTCQDVKQQLAEYENNLNLIAHEQQPQDKFTETVDQLEQQVRQRLAIIESRVQHEKHSFAEDIEDAIHDAGNAIELDISDRLKTDKWKQAKVWESIGRTNFGKELERRVNRMVSRQEKALNLLKDDLRFFQEDMKINTSSILQRHHHTHFTKLMPPLRFKTRVVNTVDDGATVTLGMGGLMLAGAGGAMYTLGVGVVLPVIAPALPILGGALVIAGIIKWFTDSDGRKDKEIRHKREALEKAMRIQLDQAKTSLEQQLDAIQKDFKKTADLTLEPLILEGQAVGRLYKMQKQVANRLTSRAKDSLAAIESKVTALPA